MIKKADIILAVSILLVTVCFCAVSALSGKSGKTVIVTVNGDIYGEYPLAEDTTEVITTKYGQNTLTIKDGKAEITDADCPDGYCVSHIPVDSEGQTVVCLPHRLVVEIKE